MENLFKKEIYKNLLVQLEQLEWNRMKVIKLWTTHLYSRWAYKQGSYIRWASIRHNIFVGKWIGL